MFWAYQPQVESARNYTLKGLDATCHTLGTDFKGDCVAKYGDPDTIDCVGDEKAAGPKDATYAEPDAAGCVGAQSPGSRDAKYGEPDAIDCVGVGNE